MAEYRVTIDIKDVAEGDAFAFADEIQNEYGASFDAQRGDFVITILKREGTTYFHTEWVQEIR